MNERANCSRARLGARDRDWIRAGWIRGERGTVDDTNHHARTAIPSFRLSLRITCASGGSPPLPVLPIRWLCRFVPKPTFCNKRALSAARSVRCDCRRHGRCQPRHARSVAEGTVLIRCVADSQCRNYACWLHNSALRCNEADPVAHQCTARAQTHRPAPRSLCGY